MKDPANESRADIPVPLQARCPETGRHFTLPVAADLGTGWSGKKRSSRQPCCPVCGNEHAWRLEEVFATA